MPRAQLAFATVAALGIAIHASFSLTGETSPLVDNWLYCGLFMLAAASCAHRARRGDAKAAWAMAAVGLVVWGLAEIVFRLTQSNIHALYPDATQTLLFVAFLFAYSTLSLLARDRMRRLDPVLALDGLLAGLAAAALGALYLFPAPGTHRGEPAVPELFLVGALIGLMFVITVIGVTGWRPGPLWALIVSAIGLNVVGDIVLVHLADAHHFHRGSPADTLFVTSALLLGLAAFHPSKHVDPPMAAARKLPAPLVSAVTALGVLIAGLAGRAPGLASGLAVGAIAVMTARMAIALELLERSRSQALGDELTGLGNRRLLMRHLERRLANPSAAEPFMLALFDLDGFKRYNDTFGHPSGDALLLRLAGRLAQAVAPGVAYRMGGDEFCAIVDGHGPAAVTVLDEAREALSERGDAFSITSSSGAVRCPAEAATVRQALGLADSRMYMAKTARGLEQAQTRDAVLKMLQERDPGLYEHMLSVASLSTKVARRLGLDDLSIQQIERAAELHDVGKIAVPDAILHKTGRLNGDERQFVREYPVVGERILRSAPALAPVAPLVRSSHERWDGNGYPDRLRGEETPLGARIIAVCDAYHSMRSEHAYRHARSAAEALAELDRCAGSQFDPNVVEVVHQALAELGE